MDHSARARIHPGYAMAVQSHKLLDGMPTAREKAGARDCQPLTHSGRALTGTYAYSRRRAAAEYNIRNADHRISASRRCLIHAVFTSDAKRSEEV